MVSKAIFTQIIRFLNISLLEWAQYKAKVIAIVSKRLWQWDRMPPKQGQHSYRCLEQGNCLVIDHSLSKVIIEVYERIDWGNYKVVDRSSI